MDPAGLGNGARKFARELRLGREHLGRAGGDDQDLLDPLEAVAAFRETALALDRWHLRGRRGERPAGYQRPPPRVHLSRATKLWAVPLYAAVYDPDARTAAMRTAGDW